MLTIRKFENVYGIKKLLHPELINGNTIIYAPNGVMKTSFADGLNDIANGVLPKDIFVNPPVDASFEIIEEGREVTAPSKGCLNLLLYRSNQKENDVFQDESISSLVMSPALKEKYKATLDQIASIKTTLNGWLSSEMLKEKKPTEEGTNILQKIIKPDLTIDLIKNIPDLSAFSSDYFPSLPYQIIFNDKTEALFSDKGFTDKCRDYQSSVNKQLDAKVFASGFGIAQLQETAAMLTKNNFFKARHKVVLNSLEPMGEKELSDYIAKAIADTYSSNEILQKFEEAKKVLEKNKQAKVLRDLISSDQKLLGELADPETLRKKIVFSVLAEHTSEIATYKTQLASLSDTLSKIIDEANKTKETWNKVLEMYNSRFVSNKLDVSISNQVEAVLGLRPARFVKKIKGTNIEATDSMLQRFSSGEKRALVILSLMYEVALKGTDNFTLVLDDVADSFDYKNKYAIIECLKDFSNKSNIQLVILTHNFDFYRSTKAAIGKKHLSNLFAYKSDEGVNLLLANQGFFDDYSYFNDWKHNGCYPDYLALIPLVRNLAQLKEGGGSEEYSVLTTYLHYSPKVETIDFLPLQKPFSECGTKIVAPLEANYWETLGQTIDKMITTPPKETDLRSKVIFGIFIRLANDRFMWNKYKIANSSDPSVTSDFNQSRELFELVKGDLTPEENSIVQTAMTIAPSFIHLNSFMYEPLIDVGGEKMVEIASALLKLNK
jgi:hypothetical protein